MRNLLLLSLLLVSIGSCKKDWACECTHIESKDTHVAKHFAQTTKSEATSLCNLYNDSVTRCEVKPN